MTHRVVGATGIRDAVAQFSRRLTEDPITAPWFEGIDMDRLRAHQRAFVAMALGGPDAYRGRSMREAHAGLGIDEPAFDRCLEHLEASLRDAGVGEDAVRRACRDLGRLRGQIVDGCAAG
ncbi:group I truncated hemoglobin [Homoserinibacter sp. YIM 151385]|uniref:group I truncated hemoglobin n=1 Tax=Homoserinibacter sp. YIM 151385 TaxID=2985506 RepID=UPI0022F0E1CE|nr:group 1 truncated hemoglobin [Homoserinibacter sp. YIM 151385]WBU37956.1 group 1 truncated hemoglobin [Homoserinibacter sp. YIM 151385]